MLLQVNTSCEEAIDKVECARSDLHADLDRWLVDKDEGITGLLRDMANEHMQYHEKVTPTWSHVQAPTFTTAILHNHNSTIQQW